MHHSHRKSSEQFGSSTLYNETGNIRLYRVSEETRKKVAEDSKRIHDDMVKHNIQSRERFRKEENQKFKIREKFRTAMISRWVEKSKDSPFTVDLYEKEMKRKMKHDEFVRQKQIYEGKVRLVASMKGEADNIYGKAAMDRMGFKSHTKMALQFQQFILDDKVINRDSRRLGKMLYDELDFVAEQFPAVAERSVELTIVDKSCNSEMFTCQSPTIDGEELSQESDFAANPYFPDDRKRRDKQQLPSGSVSTGFSGPLDYSSPQERMKALQDDLSENFSEINLL